MPFLVSTNTPRHGHGRTDLAGCLRPLDDHAPGRVNIIDLMNIVGMDDSFPERDLWILAGASPHIWEMVLQGSTGFSGSFARQTTPERRHRQAARDGQAADALETSAAEGAIRLRGEGVRIEAGGTKELGRGVRRRRLPGARRRRRILPIHLIEEASAGNMVMTLTGHSGINVDVDNPQPALWPVGPIQGPASRRDHPLPQRGVNLEDQRQACARRRLGIRGRPPGRR